MRKIHGTGCSSSHYIPIAHIFSDDAPTISRHLFFIDEVDARWHCKCAAESASRLLCSLLLRYEMLGAIVKLTYNSNLKSNKKRNSTHDSCVADSYFLCCNLSLLMPHFLDDVASLIATADETVDSLEIRVIAARHIRNLWPRLILMDKSLLS